MLEQILNHPLFVSVGIPILICLARIIDVSIGTVRQILVNKGQKMITPIIGFVEILIWITAVGQIMKHLDQWQNYIAYALGFSLGNFLGILIENRIALGNVILRIITRTNAHKLADTLRDFGYYVTIADAEANEGKVNILLLTIKRNKLKEILPVIKENNPWAIY